MNETFYITGGTLPLDADSYVPRRADTELLDGLRRGQFCYVLNTRQMGKSSLMIRAARRLMEEGCRVAILDLTAVGQNLSVEQWYFGLLVSVGAQAGQEDALFDVWKDLGSLGPMQRFVQALRRVLLTSVPSNAAPDGSVAPLVLFVDEIDAVRSLPFSADEFFAGIRECYNRRTQDATFQKLTFCLLGVAAPVDLIRDSRISPFNIGQRIEVRDFTPEEAEPLARGLTPGKEEKQRGRKEENEFSSFSPLPPYSLRLLQRVLHWTRGHPYMTQRLCREIAEQQAQGLVSEADVDRLCDRLFLSRLAQESDDNLAFVRNRLLKSEADLSTLLDLYKQVQAGRHVADDETNPLCSILNLSGVARVEGGRLRLRNRIYAQVFDAAWVRAHMPDAELRRQQRAYRLGLFRAALAGSVALAVVGSLSVVALNQAYKAKIAVDQAKIAADQVREAGEKTNRLLYATRMNLLQRAYQDENIEQARNLLDETETSPYKGFEWGYWRRLLRRETLSLPITELQSLVVWSRDGRWIITQTQSTLKTPALTLQDATTGALVRVLPGRTQALSGAPSPVSPTCVALVDAPQGEAGTVALFDPRTGQQTHALPVRAEEATLSGDGKRVFTLKRQKDNHTLVKVWDAAQGTLLSSTRVDGYQALGTLQNAATVQSSADSRLLCFGKPPVTASSRINGPLTLLDTITGKRLWTPPGIYNRYALSPTGRFLATVKDYGGMMKPYEVWDVPARRHLATLGGKAWNAPHKRKKLFLFIHFSPDERSLVGTGWDDQQTPTVWVWNTATGQEQRKLTGQRGFGYEVEFSPNGRHLLSLTLRNDLRIWDTATWENVGDYSYSNTPPTVSPAGDRFLTQSQHAVLVYPIEKEKHRSQEVRDFPQYQDARFHPDGKHLILHFVDDNAQQEHPNAFPVRSVSLNLDSNEHTQFEYTAHQFDLSSLDPTHVIYGQWEAGNRMTVMIRDTLTGNVVRAQKGLGPTYDLQAMEWPGWSSIAWDGTILRDEHVREKLGQQHPRIDIWDGNTGQKVARLPETPYIPEVACPINDLQHIFITDTEDRMHIWSVRPLREVFQVSTGLLGNSDETQVSLSPDGKYIQVVIADSMNTGRVEVYEVATGKLCARHDHASLAQPHFTAFSRDGRYRMWADVQQNVHVMEGASETEAHILRSIGGQFVDAIFSPDGKRIVTSASWGPMKLWDVETGSELMVFDTPRTNKWMFHFSPDGTRLVSRYAYSSLRHGVYLWDSNPLPPKNR